MRQIPKTIEELTPELLTATLSEKNPGIVVNNVRVVAVSYSGEGKASTADRVIIDVEYGPGLNSGLPSRLVLKTMLRERRVARSFYRNEVCFYKFIRPELTIEAPQVFASIMDEETGWFCVILEDLTLRSARFPNVLTCVTVDEVIGLLDTLAELHAQFWISPRFVKDLSWVPTPCSGGVYRSFQRTGLDLIRAQARVKLKSDILRPLRRSADQLWDDLWKVQKILDTEPTTLLHGDTHIGNTYLIPEKKGGFVDWQLMVKGSWAHDVTYLIATALDIPDRRKYEHDLITHYLDELRRRGIEPPGKDTAWALYCQAIVWGIVIGWLITPVENYGEAITETNIHRLVTAAQDLETFEAIP